MEMTCFNTQFPLLSLKERSKENEKGNKGKGDPEEERAPGKQQLAGQPRSATTSSSPSIALPFATTTAPIAPSLGRTESRRGWLVNVGGRGLGAAASPSPPRPRRAAATARVCRCHLITAGRHRRREKSEFLHSRERGRARQGKPSPPEPPSPDLLAVAEPPCRRHRSCRRRCRWRHEWEENAQEGAYREGDARWRSPLLLGADCRVAAEPIWRSPLFRFSRSSFGSIEFGCCMLRLELLRLLRKWLGTEVLAAGILIVDFGSRQKGFCDAFGLWFCVLR
ncbi:uncharacterized protein DS421_8g227060 [Arachis hypogaea]|nr:uncharacterized protein DS421_8g227060 [Arachis hypogaea]